MGIEICERVISSNRRFHACGLISLAWEFPFYRNIKGNKEPKVRWNVLGLYLVNG